MAGRGHEAGAAILKHDAGLRRDDPRAEALVERIDERHRETVLVDDGEVDRVGARHRHRFLGALNLVERRQHAERR